MSTGRVKLLAVLLLCLYGAALVHQVSPHHHSGTEAATCGLCLLVFATALAASAIVVAMFTRPMPLLAPARAVAHATGLWRSPCLRAPPRFV